MSRAPLAATLISALVVLVGVAVLVVPPDAGPSDTGRAPLTVTEPRRDGSAGPAPTTTDPSPPAAPAQVGVRSGRLDDLPAPGPAPVGIEVPGAAIDAPVVPIGVEPGSGVVAVPDDVAVAGWYRFGPAPGDPGSAVLTAHVDSASQGAGAFFPLRDVASGATVVVAFDDGSVRRFEVVGRRSYDKAALPVDELFTREGEPVLTLITCGGAFDPATRRYDENLVVFAVPVEP